jgi:hypothetical protein
MPWNLKRSNNLKDIITVIHVTVRSFDMETILDRKAKDSQIVLVFEDRFDPFGNPDVDDRVPDHPSVTTRTSCTKWVSVINEKFAILPLDNKPMLVVRKDRACTMEFFDIECACLSTRRRQCDLYANR